MTHYYQIYFIFLRHSFEKVWDILVVFKYFYIFYWQNSIIANIINLIILRSMKKIAVIQILSYNKNHVYESF